LTKEFGSSRRLEGVEGLDLVSNPVLIVSASVLLIFWLRDYMSLRMSPSCRATRRALLYGVAVLLTAALIVAVSARVRLADFARLVHSPWILLLLLAFHVAASVPSIWVKQTQSYNWMWATALVPSPIVWFFVLQTTLVPDGGVGIVGLIAIALFWATSMIVIVFRTRDIQMPVRDLDFAVLFGSLSHWLAICALPFALLMT
jgi:hypothetical protein